MKKTVLIIALLTVATAAVSGKIVRRTLGIFQSSVPETETIAKETMEFVYDYSYCVDTTASLTDNYVSDRMLLQIAPGGLSKFSSYKNLTVDSLLMRSTTEQIADAAADGRLSNGEFMTIYKNYPAGRLTHTEKICMDWFRYDEELPSFGWELIDSTATILGYECQAPAAASEAANGLCFTARTFLSPTVLETLRASRTDNEGFGRGQPLPL